MHVRIKCTRSCRCMQMLPIVLNIIILYCIYNYSTIHNKQNKREEGRNGGPGGKKTHSMENQSHDLPHIIAIYSSRLLPSIARGLSLHARTKPTYITNLNCHELSVTSLTALAPPTNSGSYINKQEFNGTHTPRSCCSTVCELGLHGLLPPMYMHVVNRNREYYCGYISGSRASWPDTVTVKPSVGPMQPAVLPCHWD